MVTHTGLATILLFGVRDGKFQPTRDTLLKVVLGLADHKMIDLNEASRLIPVIDDLPVDDAGFLLKFDQILYRYRKHRFLHERDRREPEAVFPYFYDTFNMPSIIGSEGNLLRDTDAYNKIFYRPGGYTDELEFSLIIAIGIPEDSWSAEYGLARTRFRENHVLKGLCNDFSKLLGVEVAVDVIFR
nr:hypothetical protein [Candidatus Sigynarchaeum springense]